MSNVSLYVVTVLVWGSTWLAIEYQLGVVAPEVSISYRYAAAALLLFVWCKRRRLSLSFGLRDHMLFVGLGACLFCLNYILTYYAQERLTSALTAIAFSTMLWMNIGNARLFFGVHADRRVLLGALCGIVGILVLFLPEVGSISWADTTLLGGAYCLGGAFLASLGNMISQAAQRTQLPVMQSNAYGMLYGSGLTAAIAATKGLPFNFDLSAGYVGSLLFLVVFGSVIAFGAYLTLLGRIGAHKAGYAVVMFPLVALLLSAAFEGLEMTPNLVGGAALVVAGNVLVLWRPAASPADCAPRAERLSATRT